MSKCLLFVLSLILSLKGYFLLSVETSMVQIPQSILSKDNLLEAPQLVTRTYLNNVLPGNRVEPIRSHKKSRIPTAFAQFRKTRRLDLSIPANINEAVEEIDTYLSLFFKDDYDVCSLFDLPKPEFLEPGRRISEAKCLEHIWDVKVAELVPKRIEACMKKAPGFVGIVGGRPVAPAEFPHMAAIGWKDVGGGWLFLCGGTLISNRFVLTAAHCQKASRGDTRIAHTKPRIVRLGVTNIKDPERPPTDVIIADFIKHGSYNKSVKYFDIALIRLKRSIEFNNYLRPACLWSSKIFDTKVGMVTGWGVVEKGPTATKTSDTLQVAKVDVLTSEHCDDLLKNKRDNFSWWGVQAQQLCAINLNKTGDTCSGDSGGPLQTKLNTKTKNPVYSVFGITAAGFSSSCGSLKFPAVYTKVPCFMSWIEKNVWK